MDGEEEEEEEDERAYLNMAPPQGWILNEV